METGVIDKALIIDDRYEEAQPIIQALAVKGISTIYWNGNVETKPERPLIGIRLVFLDMRFSFITDSRSITTYLITLLKHAISHENGPYILSIWSKHDNEYLEDFKKELNEQSSIPQPYLIINMEKNNFINIVYEKNEVYYEIVSTLESENKDEIKNNILEILESNSIKKDIEKVEMKEDGLKELICKLNTELRAINALSILFIWEKLVKISARNLVNNVANFSELSGTWDNNIKTLIKHLAVANAGKSLGTTAKDCIINALSTLNQMLPDELINQLMKEEVAEEKFSFLQQPTIKKNIGSDIYSISKPSKKFTIKKNNIDCKTFKCVNEIENDTNEEVYKDLYNNYLDLLGNSNFRLLCESIVYEEIKKPGTVYRVVNQDLLASLSTSIFKDTGNLIGTNNSVIMLDISSSCDYAQKKLKRIRVLPGLIVEDVDFPNIDETEDIYCTPELKIDNKVVKIVFNFHYITNESEENLNSSERLFSFRELFLTEIKHKLSTYISRVGIINL